MLTKIMNKDNVEFTNFFIVFLRYSKIPAQRFPFAKHGVGAGGGGAGSRKISKPAGPGGLGRGKTFENGAESTESSACGVEPKR